MDSITTLFNVHVAGTPTFFPAPDAKNHRCLITVMKNRGINKAGKPMTDEFTLVFWGAYAQTAALYLDKGRCINAEVVARPYTVDTGQSRADGKRILHRITNFHVRSFEFGGDTKKELITRLTENLQKAKAEGLLNPDATITAEYLLEVKRAEKYDYDANKVAETGKYGNAKVFIKGTGFVNPTRAAVPEIVAEDDLAALEAKVAALKQQRVEAPDAAPVDAFAAAQ